MLPTLRVQRLGATVAEQSDFYSVGDLSYSHDGKSQPFEPAGQKQFMIFAIVHRMIQRLSLIHI